MTTGARHAHIGDRRARRTRLAGVAVVWIAGLAAGMFAILAALVRLGGCSGGGLACSGSGTTLGVVLLVAVIAIVTAVTVTTFERDPRRVLVIAAIGLVALLVLLFAARALLATA